MNTSGLQKITAGSQMQEGDIFFYMAPNWHPGARQKELVLYYIAVMVGDNGRFMWLYYRNADHHVGYRGGSPGFWSEGGGRQNVWKVM